MLGDLRGNPTDCRQRGVRVLKESADVGALVASDLLARLVDAIRGHVDRRSVSIGGDALDPIGKLMAAWLAGKLRTEGQTWAR